MKLSSDILVLAVLCALAGCEKAPAPEKASAHSTNEVAQTAPASPSVEDSATKPKDHPKTFAEQTAFWAKRDADIVTRKAIRDYLAALKALPEDDREMALSRALNLLPDENIGILAGILMDHEIWDGLVKLAYVEILNRDDKYKLPLLKMIVKDPKHSCREEAGLMLGILGAGDE